MTSKFNVFYTFDGGLSQMIRPLETARGITEDEFIERAFAQLDDVELSHLREIKVYQRRGTSEPWANARREEFSFDPKRDNDARRWAVVKAAALWSRIPVKS